MAENRAVLTLGAKLAGQTQQAFSTVAKGIRELAGGMSEAAASMAKMGKDMPNEVFADAAKKLNKFADSVDDTRKELDGTAKSMSKVSQSADAVGQSSENAAKKISKANDELLESGEVSGKAALKIEELRLKYHTLLTTTDKLTASKAKNFFDKYTPQADDVAAVKHLNFELSQLAAEHKRISQFKELRLKFPDMKTHIAELERTGVEYDDAYQSLKKYVGLQKELNATQAKTAQTTKSAAEKQSAALAKLREKYNTLLGSTDMFAIAARKSFNSLAGNSAKIGELTGILASLDAKQKASVAVTEKYETYLGKLSNRFTDLTSKSSKYGREARELIEQFQPMAVNKMSTAYERLVIVLQKLQKEQNKSVTETQKHKKALADYRREFFELRNSGDSYAQAANKIIDNMGRLGLSAEKVKKALQNLQAQQTKATKEAKKYQDTLQRLSTSYGALKASNSSFGKDANKVITALKAKRISADEASAALKRLNYWFKESQRNSNPLADALGRVGRSLKTYASYMVASSAIFQFIYTAKQATQAIIEYDQSLKDLQAITSSTDQQTADMAETLKQVASNTKFSATETANGMKLIGQAGFDTKEIIKSIGPITELATGTLSSMDTTVDLVTTGLRVFNLEASETGRVTDVFANAVNRSKLTIDKLRIALNYVGPIAQNAGFTIEETAAAMMALANKGIRASTIGTGLRQVFSKLVSPSKAMADALHHAGMELEDLNPKTHSMTEVIANLSKVVKTTDDAFKMFGMRGSSAVLALVDQGTNMEYLLDVVSRSGAASDMAKTQLEGLGLAVKNLQDKIKLLYVAGGENGLAGMLKFLIDAARGLIDVLTDLANNPFAMFILKMGLALVATKALTAALSWFGKTGFITTACTSISTTMTSMQTAALGAAGGVRSLSGAFAALKVAAMSFLPTAIIMGLGYIITKAMALESQLDSTSLSLQRASDSFEDQSVALELMADKYDSMNVPAKDHKKAVEDLVAEYPEFESALRRAAGDGEEFAEVLRDIAEAQKENLRLSREEQWKTELKSLTLNRMKAEEYNDSWKKILSTKDEVKKKNAEFDKKEAEHLSKLIKLGQQLGKQDISRDVLDESHIERALSKESTDAIIQDIKDRLDAIAEQERESAKELGKNIREGLDEGLQGGGGTPYIDAETEKATLEASKKSLEKYLAETTYKIQEAEAKGEITHEQAETQKLNVTMGVYDKMAEAANSYYERVSAHNGTEQEIADAEDKVNQALEKAYQVRLQKLEAFAQQHQKIQGKITQEEQKANTEKERYSTLLAQKKVDLENDIVDKNKAANTRITEIENETAQKRKEILENFNSKTKELARARVEIERKAAADIQGISDSTADKIRKIELGQLEGFAKQVATASTANERLQQGLDALEQARKKNDKAAIARAQELIETASGYYEELEDPDQAISGLKRVEKALIEARKAQETAELAENKEKLDKETKQKENQIKELEKKEKESINNVKAKLAEKMAQIERDYGIWKTREKERHDQEMNNIQTEINKLKEKQALIRGAQNEVTNNSAPSSPVTETDQNNYTGAYPSASNVDLSGYQTSVETATAQGIQKGVERAAESTKQDIRNSVGEGVQAGIFDGVEVNGIPLEEWKKQGKKQGDALGEAASQAVADKLAEPDFEIMEEDSVPVAVKLQPAKGSDVQEMMDQINEDLKKYPGEPEVDTKQAYATLQELVKKAERNLSITIPVNYNQTQNKATGGAVQPVVPMAVGGKTPGSKTIPGTKSLRDKVHVLARPGEWFLPDESVNPWLKNVGSWFMDAVHKPFSDAGQRLMARLTNPEQKPRYIPKIQPSSGRTNPLTGLQSFGTITVELSGQRSTLLADQPNALIFAKQLQALEDDRS